MAGDLPRDLKAAIAAMLEGVSRKELAARAAQMSDDYRAGGGSATVIAEPADVLAYLVTRMPATYAAVAAALRGRPRSRRRPSRRRRFLDVGAGPGHGELRGGRGVAGDRSRRP